MNMIKKIISLIYISLCSLSVYAQKENINWYFGAEAGVTFESGAPVALTDGAIMMQEGCATISDSDGNLLFYTNGMQIWNKKHQIMPNGDGLDGHNTATQSGLIVPSPDGGGIYYVFTVGAFTDSTEGRMSYSIVDLNLDDGLGDVTEKNNLLIKESTEKITAVKHENNKDIWVIGHELFSNQFNAYLVTNTGVADNPVISNVGTVDTTGVGYMKVSPDGKTIAAALSELDTLELYSFDYQTGIVSDPISINLTARPYGIEFSPNGEKLYVSIETAPPSNIYQFSLINWDQETISDSKSNIAKSNNSVNALQLGPDGKIYVSKFLQKFLGAIENPNDDAQDIIWTEEAVDLKGKVCRLGLPTFIQSYFIESSTCDLIVKPINILCFGDQGSILVEPTDGNAPYDVYLDGELIASGISETYEITVSSAGNYKITTIDANGCEAIQTTTVEQIAKIPLKFRTVYKKSFAKSNLQALYFNGYGGLPPYQFSVNGVDYFDKNKFYGLDNGTYTIYIKDSVGCIVSMKVVL